MLKFIEEVIKRTAVQAGIPDGNIILEAKNSLIMPKPALSVEFLEETITKSGYYLKRDIDKENKKFKTVLSLYEVRLPVICNLYGESYEQVSSISSNFIKMLPRKLADKDNNIIKIKATSSTWEIAGGSTVGIKRIEPIKTRERLIKIDVTYHIAENKDAGLINKVIINKNEVKQ